MRRRLVTLALASTGLVALAFLVPLFSLVSQLATDRAVRPAELVARSLAPTAALVDDGTLADLVATAAVDVGGEVSVVMPDDRVVGDPLPADGIVEEVRRGLVATRVAEGGRHRVLVPVVVPDGVAVVDVRVDIDRTGVVVAWVTLALLGLALVAGASLLADRLARRTVAAAASLEDTADRLSAGELDARADVLDPPDLARVGRALDQLAGRIGALLAEAGERAADLSHGLRTPATVLRLDAEALSDSPGRTQLLDDLAHLDRAISAVIEEARTPVREGAGAGIDLAGVVRDRVAFWRGLADDESRTITVDVPERPVDVTVAARDLSTLLDVTLDNAFRHTPTGTAVRVAVHTARGLGLLTVEDDGPGLPAGGGVLERGRSGGGGSGLGLDIARTVTERAGGGLTVTDRRSTDVVGATGLRVRASFPLAP